MENDADESDFVSILERAGLGKAWWSRVPVLEPRDRPKPEPGLALPSLPRRRRVSLVADRRFRNGAE